MKILIIQKLRELANAEADISFGDLLYTINRPKFHKGKKVIDTTEVSDNDYYTAIERAIEEAKK